MTKVKIDRQKMADEAVNEIWKYLYERYNIETDEIPLMIMSNEHETSVNGMGMLLMSMEEKGFNNPLKKLGYKTVNKYYKYWYEYIMFKLKTLLSWGEITA